MEEFYAFEGIYYSDEVITSDKFIKLLEKSCFTQILNLGGLF
jgi:hypothetical protein